MISPGPDANWGPLVRKAYDSFSDKVLDQVTKRLKIQKSFKHVFSGDFAFLYARGKCFYKICHF